MDPIWTTIISVLGAITAVGSVAAVFYKSRGEAKSAASNAKAALDARIDARVKEQLTDAWGQIDKLKQGFETLEKRETRRTGAITRILRAIAAQWPASVPGPDLDPADIQEIEETIPSAWIRKAPKAS